MRPARFSLALSLLFLGSALIATAQEEIVSRIKRTPVESTNVASIGYSSRLHALEIEFSRGAIYRFLDVPPAIYRDLMRADSKGHFINTRLRGKFRYVRVHPPKPKSNPNEAQPNE